ncbi:acetate--CoA ligase family protein [Sporosarcina sp. FSL K6-1522]|uniref:acetate--CoA ligase family protein n=1 Tax=Sporosarcina sp. FSL K6-1522 TaxID=2921554 RepID=UPI003159AA23
MTVQQENYVALEPLFNPKSVAILGASENKNKLGYLQVKALLDGGFAGDIYPINPRSEKIEGLLCYPSLAEVKTTIDLAIFCLSADRVKQGLLECAENGIKAAVVFASGFSETGEEGLKEQQLISDLAKEHGIRIIGPNCVGLVNTTNGLVATFSPGLTNVPLNDKREVGFVTQSGAFGVLTYIAAAQKGLSFNYFVSVGNEMETEFSDVVEYMVHDPKTKVISGYLEGAKNPQKLRQLAKEALAKNKPMVIMKTGRSAAGSRAAASHTGSLAGSDQIYDAFFKQTGIVRANDFEDIIAFSKLFQTGKIPKGRNTVIVTSSGGRGINEADRCESYGLNIHPLSFTVKKAIEKNIPSFASASNPVDLTAAAAVTNPELFLEPLRVLVDDPDTDIIIFSEFPMHWTYDEPLIKEFIDICKNTDKFILITTFQLEGMSIPKSTPELVANGIPVITGDLNPIRALAKFVEYGERYEQQKQKNDVGIQPQQAKKDITPLVQYKTTLSEAEASEVLALYDIPTTQRMVATTAQEAVQHANSMGYPVALKIDSPDIPHKTEANAIKLNVKNDQEVMDAFDEIDRNARAYDANAVINGVSIQEMLPAGVEVIVGVTNDPGFGPVIMFGLGGIFVEVFRDISFRVAPLTRDDALEMIEEIKGYAILKGARGKAAVDIEAIVDVLLKVSALVTDHGDHIDELDINPLIVYEDGIKAADAMLVVRETEVQASVGVGG